MKLQNRGRGACCRLDEFQVFCRVRCKSFERFSCHVFVVVLNFSKGGGAERVSRLSVQDLVRPAVAFAEHCEFELLLLLLHLVLSLEQQFCNLGKSLFDAHLAESSLFDFVASQLATTTGSTSVVLEARARGLHHPQRSTSKVVVRGKND